MNNSVGSPTKWFTLLVWYSLFTYAPIIYKCYILTFIVMTKVLKMFCEKLRSSNVNRSKNLYFNDSINIYRVVRTGNPRKIGNYA